MPEFKIEGGNSTDGEIGFVSYIKADNAEHALEKFKDAVGFDNNDLRLRAPSFDTDEDIRVHVYFNPAALKVSEHVSCDEEEDEKESVSDSA